MTKKVQDMTDGEIAEAIVSLNAEVDRRKFVSSIPKRAAALLNDAERAGVSLDQVEAALRREATAILNRKTTKR